MKTNYDKYMEEVWESKEQVYQDFKKIGFEHYTDFIKNELKNVRVIYHNKNVSIKKEKSHELYRINKTNKNRISNR